MEQAFESPREGNISLQDFARAVESATTVPAAPRDMRPLTPRALGFARRSALTRQANARQAASQSQAGVTTASSWHGLDVR